MSRTLLPALLLAVSALHAQSPVPAQTESDRRLPAKGGTWGLREGVVKDASLPNVLMIGDSILNGYLAAVQKALAGRANIDAWVTPISQGDKQLPVILTGMLGAKKYTVIHFNLGLHGWQKGRIPEGQFEQLTHKMVQAMKGAAPDVKLVWATITPVTVKGDPEKLNPEIQPTIVEHNAMALKVMQEEGVAVDDLSALMLPNLKLAAGDMFHWKTEGRDLQAKAVADALAKALPVK